MPGGLHLATVDDLLRDALSVDSSPGKNPQTPLTGLLPLNSSSPVQNSMVTTAATSVVTISGTAYPTGVTSITNAQFASRFGLFDNIARSDIDTGKVRFPLTFLGDYVQNTEACSNVASLLPAPANTTSQTFKQTSNACNSHQRRGYWAEARMGRLQQKGDLQFGYTRIYVEREAVLGNFNYSELRQGTNVTQHRVDTFYQFDPSVQLGFTALVGRPLASTEPWLTRLQFDVIYIFMISCGGSHFLRVDSPGADSRSRCSFTSPNRSASTGTLRDFRRCFILTSSSRIPP